MSTAAASSRRSEWLPWIGHNAWWLQLVFNVYFVVSVFLTMPWWSIGVLPLIVWLLWRERKHDLSLCEKCISEMPLDPQTAITRQDRWLRGYHIRLFKSRRSMWIGIAVFLVGYIAWSWFIPAPWSKIPFLLLIGVLSPLAVFSTKFHKQLQPWCPYCPPDEDDDDEEFAPVPDPVMENTK